jgi:hypothetical protein
VPTTTGYDLDAAEVSRRTAAALAAHPATRGGRFLALVVGPDDPLAGVGRALERRVFEDAFGNDASVMTAEYGPYEQQSLFFVVLDRRRGVPAGVGRIIEDHGPRVKTIADAPAHIGRSAADIMAVHGMTSGKVWDFATVAVLPEYRGRSSLAVSSLLYRMFLVAGRRAGARHVVAMLDRRAYRNIRLLGVPVETLAGSGAFAYLGSAENRAVYVGFPLIERCIAMQSIRLRRPGAPILGELPGRGLRRVLIRHAAAGISRRVATGRGLDQHIVFA